MRIERVLPTLLALVLAILLLALVPRTPAPGAPGATGSDAASALAANAEAGYAQALAARPFAFPADHAAHPRFKTEWWYLTGTLWTPTGRRFGYQFTIFRNALRPVPAQRPSAWGSNQLYFAHLALSDLAPGRFHHDERYARGAAGLAGAEAERVWLEDWRIEGDPHHGCRVDARGSDFTLELELEPGKGHVLRGEAGLSAKSASPGNHSHYYSFPRMPTSGRISVDGTSHPVSGTSWYDREWSTSALEPTQVGWDWFALQLADGRDLMLFQLRRADGSADFSAGGLTAVDGSETPLGSQDFSLHALAWWTSPRSGGRYPIAWRLAVPGHGIRGEVRAALLDQEHHGSFGYWEGAVDLDGSVDGVGYLEMTGYAR